jgi:hypothetical protein
MVETPTRAQANHFLWFVGGDIDGLLLAVDFEAYSQPYAYLTPGTPRLGASSPRSGAR